MGGLDTTPASRWLPRDWLGSLKARMALVLGLVLLLPAAYAVYQAVSVYDSQAERQIMLLRNTTSRIAKTETELVARTRGLLEQLAAKPELLAGPEACAAFLGQNELYRDRFLDILATDAAGHLACSASGQPPVVQLQGQPWLQAVEQHGGLFVDTVPVPNGGEVRHVLLAVPLLHEGGFAGILAGSLSLARFSAVQTGLELPEGTVAYLVDRAAVLLTPTPPGLRTLPGRAEIARLVEAPDAMTLVDGPGGRMRFVAAPVQAGQLYALVGLAAPRWSWLERDLVLGVIAPVLMLGLAVIGIWIATDYLVNRHIHALAFAARSYALGRHAGWPSLKGAPTELRQLAAVLARTTRELGAREDELTASLSQKEFLLREIHHRVKNNLQVVTSLINLRAQAASAPAVRAAMIEAQSRVKALALVHRDLYESGEAGTVELRSLVSELCNLVEDTASGRSGEIEVRTRLEPVQVSIDRAVPIALFVTETLSNAFKHAFPEGAAGCIEVRLQRVEGGARLAIQDDGVGLEGRAGGMPGLGMTLMRMLAGQTGGRLTVEGRSGTLVQLDFPLAEKTPGPAKAKVESPVGS